MEKLYNPQRLPLDWIFVTMMEKYAKNILTKK